MFEGTPILDLDYIEDSQAEVDLNVVMSGSGEFIEVQGTAEGKPFSRELLNQHLDLAAHGIAQLTRLQREALGNDQADVAVDISEMQFETGRELEDYLKDQGLDARPEEIEQ